jgi:hypothetical protein
VKTLAIVLAFNEVAALAGVISELRERHPCLEVLVIGGASTDGTGELRQDPVSATCSSSGGASRTSWQLSLRAGFPAGFLG